MRRSPGGQMKTGLFCVVKTAVWNSGLTFSSPEIEQWKTSGDRNIPSIHLLK